MRGGLDQAGHRFGAGQGPAIGETVASLAENRGNLTPQSARMNMQGSTWSAMDRALADYRRRTGENIRVSITDRYVPGRDGPRPISHEVAIVDARGNTPPELRKWTSAGNLVFMNPYSVRSNPKPPKSTMPRPASGARPEQRPIRTQTRPPYAHRPARPTTRLPARPENNRPRPAGQQRPPRTESREYLAYRQRLRDTDRNTVRERRRQVTEVLLDAGVTDVRSHLRGWDLSRPVYIRSFEPSERLMQQIRNDRSTGQYFGLPGNQSNSTLGIGSGPVGRTLGSFVVARPFQALEGTAAPISRRWAKATARTRNEDFRADPVRGNGGATQVFIPTRGISTLLTAEA
jgi:hypothetical protein